MTLPRVEVRVFGSTVIVEGLEYPLGTLPSEDHDPRAYGRALFDALLAKAWPVITQERSAFELALLLPVDLHRWAWEAMHDGEHPLAAHPGVLVAVTRVLPTAWRAPDRVRRTPRVLFASGAEITHPEVRAGAMFLGLLRDCDSQGLAMARIADNVTLDALALRCEALQPDLVHLVTHADLDHRGRLYLQFAGRPESADQVAEALAEGERRPVAVVLSSCHTAGVDDSSLAAALIERGVAIVVAMGGEIGEQACRLFSKRLVRALLNGDSVAEAAAHGRRAALRAESDPGERLDWAMPIVFTGDQVTADFQPFDPAPARAVKRMGEQLTLLQRPVFIGHRPIFDEVDALFTRERALLAATTTGGFSKLGATRLLREIGFRLLQAGHLPLLIAPIMAQTAPGSLRQAVADVLRTAVRTARQLALPLPRLRTLDGTGEERSALLRAIADFRALEAPPQPDELAELLALDLDALAETAGRVLGEPFGAHTRVAVLAEALHLWEGALGWIQPPGLLDLLTASGLGTPARPAPLIATAAIDACAPLRAFESDQSGLSTYRLMPLRPLSDEEAALGYQWVLLNPWLPDHPEVYLPTADHDRHALRETFKDEFEGRPALIGASLYKLARILTRYGQLRPQDDEGAWTAYARLHGLKHE
ncbi:CHAT domain-containing protein [Nonomuraea sp. NPDC046570]|uniref:CHAT domain-containing protein n=1 Tax=Nonomuraea sp. NPDC046570 TaxID=3155255 RepID=UPI0034050A00